MEMRLAANRKQISDGSKLRSLGVKTMAAIKSTAAMQPLTHRVKITQLNPRACIKWQRLIVVVVNDDIRPVFFFSTVASAARYKC